MATLKELAVQFAKKQPKQVDYVTQEAPILNIIPFEPASHSLWNVYEEVQEVIGGGFVDQDSVLPDVGLKSRLKKIDLSIMGGEATVGEDKARQFGGPIKYFARQEPAILRKTGMTTEYAILYNNLRAYAIANSKKVNAGGSAGTNYSIIAVRFVPGETTGLYSPNGFSNGAMFDVQALNGGNLMKINVTENGETKAINGYAVRYKSYIGMQCANPLSVAVLANIDLTSSTKKVPTADMLNQLADLVRASNSGTFFFMHPKVKSALYGLKTTQLMTTVNDKNFDTAFDRWNGIPIVTSYNFVDGTEANVSF